MEAGEKDVKMSNERNEVFSVWCSPNWCLYYKLSLKKSKICIIYVQKYK